MCKFFPIQTSITWSVLSAQEVDNIFRAAGVRCFEARDDYYWYPDENTWIEWIKGAHNSAPAYQSITETQRGFDCDKFARHLCDHVATKYLANGCFEVWGTTSFGQHGWNVILTPSGAFEVEPQNADIWAIGTNPEYKITTVYHAD